MYGTLKERALEGLHDYAIWLRERGDKSDVLSRTRDERDEPTVQWSPLKLNTSKRLEAIIDDWENEMIREWREAGRLTEDGVLRVTHEPLPPWTLQRIGRTFPGLKGFDRWAVLIAADGVFRGNEMAKDPHQNIREVIEEIVDLRQKKNLREELANIFDEVMTQVRADAPLKESERSTVRPGRKHQVHRVRHPKTNELVSREERDAYAAANPKPEANA